MKKNRILSILFALTLAASPALAQTWFTVVPVDQQNPNVSVTLPAEATWRIGDYQNNKWTAPVTVTASTTVIDYADGSAGHPPDPDSGTSKEFDVLETASAQTVTVNGAVVAIPALPPPTAWSANFIPGTVYAASLTPSVLPNSTAANLLAALSVPPPQLIAGVLQNFTYTLTLNGVPFTCTFGTLTTSGSVTLNCIPASLPAS